MHNATNSIDLWRVANGLLKDAGDNVHPDIVKLLSGHIRARNIKGVCDIVVIPSIATLQEYRCVSQIQALFKSNSDFSIDEACTAAAEKRFFEAEKMCRISNKRIRHYAQHNDRSKFGAQWLAMKHFIWEVLGPVTSCLEAMPENLRWTSGATENRAKKLSQPHMKCGYVQSVTPGSLPLLTTALKYFGAVGRDVNPELDARRNIYTIGKFKVRLIDSNRVVCVPKNFKTHRTIAAEPAGNLPFQLAIDSYLKRRLRRFGCDLRDQNRNKDLAKSASLNKCHATIDLSMASDTISYELVRGLLPDSWFKLLTALRSPCYKGTFGRGVYAKFSSMGNGYTFSLETLLFLAACKAVGSETCSVYGDDIIIETELADELLKLLRFMGFKPNEDKTFLTGDFRESCGGDYLNGIDVRPFFVKKSTNLRKTEISHVINGLVRVCNPNGIVWNYCRDLVRLNKLHLVPANPDTQSGIHIPVSDAYSIGIINFNDCVLRFRAYQSKPINGKRLAREELRGYLYSTLTTQIRVISRSAVIVEDSFHSYKRVPVADFKVVTGKTVLHPCSTRSPHLYAWYEYLCRR